METEEYGNWKLYLSSDFTELEHFFLNTCTVSVCFHLLRLIISREVTINENILFDFMKNFLHVQIRYDDVDPKKIHGRRNIYITSRRNRMMATITVDDDLNKRYAEAEKLKLRFFITLTHVEVRFSLVS